MLSKDRILNIINECINTKKDSRCLKRSKPKVKSDDQSYVNQVHYVWTMARFEAGLTGVYSAMTTVFFAPEEQRDKDMLDFIARKLSSLIDADLAARRDFAMSLGAPYLKS